MATLVPLAGRAALFNVWKLMMEVASHNPDLKVIAQGTTVGGVIGAVAGWFLGGENKVALSVAGGIVGGIVGGTAASMWVGKDVYQILNEMGPEKRQILIDVALDEAKKLPMNILKDTVKLAAFKKSYDGTMWLVRSFNRAFGAKLG